jgi:UDP-glucose 4-epimerase
MRVLVTGAAGFVGRAVVADLTAAGHEVRALVRTAPDEVTDLTGRSGAVETVAADIRDRDALVTALTGVDGICHLAARTDVRGSFADPVGHFDVNVGGTTALLAALALALAGARPDGLRRAPAFVLASTAAVYGVADRYPVDEDTPRRPSSPYAASKVAAEALVGHAASAGLVAATVLRFTNVGGPGDPDPTRLLPAALAAAAGARPHLDVNGDGSTRRDHVHVADVASACRLAVEAARPGEGTVYNVGSGTAVSVVELVAMVEDVTGRPVPVRNGPAVPEPPVIESAIGRIAAALGWTPTRSDLRTLVADAWADRRC